MSKPGKMRIKYLAWLSSKGERRKLKGGAVYAGIVRDCPAMYKDMLDPEEKRQYLVIYGT